MMEIKDDEISFLLPHMLDFLYARGFIHAKRTLEGEHSGGMHVPFTLLPRALPASAFNFALTLAAPFNALVDAISRDHKWLAQVLADTAAADGFTGRLLEMFLRVSLDASCSQQPLSLHITRSDYMISNSSLKQVELNTVAVSLAGHASTIGEAHAYAAGRFYTDERDTSAIASHFRRARSPLVPSNSRSAVAAALVAAHEAYRTRNMVGDTILFVVSDPESNIFDQRALETEIWAAGVRVRRATLAQLATGDYDLVDGGSPSHPTLTLHLPSETSQAPASTPGERRSDAVSVIYFRAGYSPNDFADDNHWKVREDLERCDAIKCPTLGAHLAGTKKVQQVLAQPGELERFFHSQPHVVQALRSCFAGLWPLDGSAGAEAAVAAARANPDDFVIKPQREGGGHNYFGEQVSSALCALDSDPIVQARASMTREVLNGHILMERLRPDVSPAIFVRAGVVSRVNAVSELGIYGVFLGDGASPPILNQSAGHLLRTKTLGVDEGGIAAGFAVLDSPLLV
jgi:glutathione synthetase